MSAIVLKGETNRRRKSSKNMILLYCLCFWIFVFALFFPLPPSELAERKGPSAFETKACTYWNSLDLIRLDSNRLDSAHFTNPIPFV